MEGDRCEAAERKGAVGMITIIKHGTIKKKRCDSCGCVFTYEDEDVEFDCPSRYSYSFVTCPQCKEEIKLEVTR